MGILFWNVSENWPATGDVRFGAHCDGHDVLSHWRDLPFAWLVAKYCAGIFLKGGGLKTLWAAHWAHSLDAAHGLVSGGFGALRLVVLRHETQVSKNFRLPNSYLDVAFESASTIH